jgi:hypothetical protein
MLRACAAACACVSLTSCQSGPGGKGLASGAALMYRQSSAENTEDFDDPNRVDRNQEQMMLDARRGLEVSREPDKWFADYFQSEEARSIERSLGVEKY